MLPELLFGVYVLGVMVVGAICVSAIMDRTWVSPPVWWLAQKTFLWPVHLVNGLLWIGIVKVRRKRGQR